MSASKYMLQFLSNTDQVVCLVTIDYAGRTTNVEDLAGFKVQRGAPANKTTSPISVGSLKRRLLPDESLFLGRHLDHHLDNCHINFQSKVVSRQHARIWMNSDMEFFIQDCGSSTGTFLNGQRMSPGGQESEIQPLKDGDALRLGSSHRGGLTDTDRCVNVQVRLYIQPKLNSFNLEECCICLNSMTPGQALFVSSCGHLFHYKCSRPLLLGVVTFHCPLCRTKVDLDEDFDT
ncbi:SMAD/FHA domain-containing protein [Hesseltinella vesiculosa]|uniref:SMAD/FHA domain-containing protein n=1 Tax=Hesseltinella vesiculosa TaxID=101127 RepID=A0A1X2GXQ8_9FUNG|nr:SMAD/FHA domain-containing protein [Hesseltinella vesiculosa]